MGIGDSIMVSSIAKRISAIANERVVVHDGHSGIAKDPVWDGLDYIAQDARGRVFLLNAPGARHYYSGMEGDRIIWRKWDIAPGEIRLTEGERDWAISQFTMGGQHPRFIVLNPDFKAVGGGGSNKNWGLENWEKVTRALPDILVVQLSPPGPFVHFDGTVTVHTPTFRHACAILERSIGYVGHEGGLHHAAAALGKLAVVVFGGYISPEVTGYPTHKNLYVPDERYPLGCGKTTPCEHCREAMSKITVEEVVNAVKEMVDDAGRN